MHKSRLTPGLLTAIGLFLAASPAWAARVKSDADKGPEKPPLPAIVSLELQPKSLTLTDDRDARQVLVWAVAEDGRRFDVTDLATFSAQSPMLQVGTDHYVHATAAGDGTVVVSAVGKETTLSVSVSNAALAPVRFVRDIEPVLAAVGCNAGTCHGAAKGKNGFKLSLRGYDPEFDYAALAQDLQGRRINRVQPDQSLMLLKPTGAVAHEGRTLFHNDSRQYQLIYRWIEEGANFDPQPATARPNHLEVLPAEAAIDLPGRTQTMIVIAHYPDGTTRDVTRDAILTSNSTEVAKIAGNQITALRRGEAAILVRYEGNYGVMNVSVMGDRRGYVFSPMPEYNLIDKYINAKLEKAKILPSEECTDDEFIRRVYLDLTGIIPSADAAQAFIDDPTPSQEKRHKLVEQLLNSRDYVAFWSNRWADLLQCNSKALGEKGVWVFREWIRQSIARNKPYDQFVHELITAQGDSYTTPAVNYYRALRDTGKITEDVSQTFLGVRFNCNKCHDHPFERWTQDQYYQFGAFFSRIAFKPGAMPGEEIVYASYNGGEVMHPRTGAVMQPTVPFGTEPDVQHAAVREDAFATWLTSKENPLFARSYVNRVWSYFFGRGIIEPVDDIRASNPPVNPELLDALTADFIAHDFDARQLIQTIVGSRTYQLSVIPNRWNEDDKINFSHAIPRRLSAEQLRDAVAIATGTKDTIQGLPAGMRSVYMADGLVEDDFLKLFGRPKRESACECERTSNVSLAHALNLVNGPVINNAVDSPDSAIVKLAALEPDNHKVVRRIYLMILNRPPTEAEQAAINLGQGAKRIEVAQDLAWALLNSPAFLFNR
ncbi:MAG TPA: DUF1549 and DUF1553 domain-containing protein [Humisphaera sp.]|jgi:hypothetical protein|nr:DUF1549 and DUF1553 domain-containing protein [Humisphaera sp.]